MVSSEPSQLYSRSRRSSECCSTFLLLLLAFSAVLSSDAMKRVCVCVCVASCSVVVGSIDVRSVL